MELISKEVVRRIIGSGRTKEQMLGMVECAVADDSSTELSTEQTDSSTGSSTDLSTGTFDDDCISRKAVLDTTICEGISCNECSFSEIDGEPGCLLHKRIDDLPSVKPKERTGHWMAVYQGDEIINYRCSECEFGNTFGKNTDGMYYCPRCGTRMIESH